MSGKIDISEVKALLQERVVDLCAHLLPTGRRHGQQWVSHNPVTGDVHGHKHTPALKVSLGNNPAPGAFVDWRSGDKGDVLMLIAYLNNHAIKDMQFARSWALDWLGIKRLSTDDRRALAKKALASRKIHEEQDANRRIWRIKMANKLFMQAGEFSLDSPARRLAFAYFEGRGIPIDIFTPGKVPFNLDPLTFRFSNATEYWTKAEWKTVDGRRIKARPGPEYPAIHAAMRSPTGQLTACHVTFLDPQKPIKAAEDPPKLIFGEARGSMIRISHGKSNLPPEKDLVAGRGTTAEGIETEISICHAMPDLRGWACGSLAGFGSVPMDMACIGEMIFCRDNNFGNVQARTQFDNGLALAESHGKPIEVINSPVGDDFNDLVQDA